MLNKIIELGISKTEAEELIKISKNIEEDYNKLLKQYPIQYLIGYVNFYGNKINVNENVLIPRYETEYLVEKTIKYSKKYLKDQISILDIGTGSGAIAITLSKELNSDVTAADISQLALETAKNNAKLNGTNINFIKSDLFENVHNKFDIIISNPPYIDRSEEIMESVYKYEPHLALYAENNGLYFYEEIIKNAKDYLNEKFIIAFEIGYKQAENIKSIAKQYFENSIILSEQDLQGKDRYIFIINE